MMCPWLNQEKVVGRGSGYWLIISETKESDCKINQFYFRSGSHSHNYKQNIFGHDIFDYLVKIAAVSREAEGR